MQSEVEEFLFPEPRFLLDRLSASTGPRFAALNVAIGQMLEEFSLVSFVPLDVTDEERYEPNETGIGMLVSGWPSVHLLLLPLPCSSQLN